MQKSIKKPLTVVVMGVSGCGKTEVGSRLAAALGCRHLEGDTYHSPANIQKMSAGQPLNDEDRRAWLIAIRDKITEVRQQGQSLVVSCSALKHAYRDILRSADPMLRFLHLEGSMDLIASRMQARPGHFMPVSLLQTQFRDLEPLRTDELGIVLDIRTPPEQLIEQCLAALASDRPD